MGIANHSCWAFLELAAFPFVAHVHEELVKLSIVAPVPLP